MRLSIIVPCYNVSAYIDRCIDSLEEQDISDYEIIAVNDCSTDNTLEKLIALSDKFKNLIVIDKETNSGLSDTRNHGLKVAQGEHILFIDSDDYIDKNSLGELCTLLDTYNPDILYYGYIIEKSDRKIKVFNYKSQANKLYINHEFIEKELKNRNLPIPACVACYKRNFLIENELWFEKGILHEDVRWSPIALYKADKVYTSELMFYHYILRSDSISQKKDKTKNAVDLIATCEFLQRISNEIEDQELRKKFINYIAMTYMKTVATTGILNHKDVARIDRFFPIRNACFWQDFLKAIIFAISPRLYEKIYLFHKLKVKKDII